jgi:hypothetical protein
MKYEKAQYDQIIASAILSSLITSAVAYNWPDMVWIICIAPWTIIPAIFWLFYEISNHIKKKRKWENDADYQLSKYLRLTAYMNIRSIVPKNILKEMREAYENADYERIKNLWEIGSKDHRDWLFQGTQKENENDEKR